MRTLLTLALILLVASSFTLSSRADTKPETTALIKNAIKAHGGEKALKKYKAATATMEGKVEVMGQTIDFSGQWSYQLPDKLKNEMAMSAGGMEITIVTVMNGDKGWMSINGMTQEMPKEMIEAGKHERQALEASQLVSLLDGKHKLSMIGESKVMGKPAIGINVTKKGMPEVSFYFDKKTHLLVKMEMNTKDFNAGGEEVSQATMFSNYKKDKNGLMQPSKIVIEKDGKSFMEAKITEMNSQEKIGDDAFGKP